MSKKTTLIIICYLLIGFVVSVAQYFITNPALSQACPAYVAQFKCQNTLETILMILSYPNFWFNLIIWPWNFIFGVFFAR